MDEEAPAPRRLKAVKPPSPDDLAEDRAAALALTPVSRETAARLDRLVALLLEWQHHTNLVAASTLPSIWTRHVADSLQLLRLAPDAGVWVDFGSGAGFPGLVVACALADAPGVTVHLVESTHKKCTFLAEAIEATGAPAVVHCRRAEEFIRTFNGKAQVVTARALARLNSLLELAAPLLKTGTIGLFPKGQDVAVELTAASKCWKIEASIEPSLTSELSGIVVVRKLAARAGSSRG